jgi:DNA-binding NarL/FixJ family response regulator
MQVTLGVSMRVNRESEQQQYWLAASLLDSGREDILRHTDALLRDAVLSRQLASEYADDLLDAVVSDLRGAVAADWYGPEGTDPVVHPMETLRITSALSQSALEWITTGSGNVAKVAEVVSAVSQALNRVATQRLARDFSSYAGAPIEDICDLQRDPVIRRADVDGRALTAMAALRRTVEGVRGLTADVRLTEPLDRLEKALHHYLDTEDSDGNPARPGALDVVLLVLRDDGGCESHPFIPRQRGSGEAGPDVPDERRATILVIADHTLVREGLAEILELSGDATVVAEAGDSQDVIVAAAGNRPEVVLRDNGLTGEGVATPARRGREALKSKMHILDMAGAPKLLRDLLRLGRAGYSLNGQDQHDVVTVGPSAPKAKGPAEPRPGPAYANGEAERVLSGREREILEQVAQAMSNSQIAARLRISESTVKRHMHNIFGKLGAVSRIDAVNKAVAASMIGAVQLSRLDNPRIQRSW